MKVLHVITGLETGGAEAALCRLVTADRSNTHQVVSLMDEGTYGAQLVAANIGVHVLRMPRGRITLGGMVHLFRLIRKIRPDIIQTWMYHSDLIGGVMGRLAGVKVICWGIRGPFDAARTSRSTTLIVTLCARLSRWLPAAIISNSEHARQAHVNAGYVSDKLTIIANGFATDVFHPDPSAREVVGREFGIPANTRVLGMVARFDPHKDHGNLFAALAIVRSTYPAITCLLIGAGMDEHNPALEELVSRHGVQDIVRPLGPRRDVPALMAALDLHVLSSAAESFPNVVAEAMACGIPCVTTNVGDAATIVGATGWVVPPSNPVALANAIVHALDEMDDPARWRARKAAARAAILDNYGIAQMVARYNQVWSQHVHE